MARENRFRDLAGILEKRLAGLAEGARLPSEQSLAEEYGVGKSTLRRALDLLASAGQVRKVNGVGVTVANPARGISRELVFLCHDLVFFAETARHFGLRALAANYYLSIVPLAGDERTQERLVMSVMARRPAGVMVHACRERKDLAAFRQLAAAGTATLYLMRLPDGVDGNVIDYSAADALREIVRLLYREGCRRFALFGDAAVNADAAREREEGFRAGMRQCRLRVAEDACCRPDTEPERLERFFALFIDPARRPEAVCCMNDAAAGHLVKQLRRRGISLAGLRFSGYNHLELGDFFPAPLLTAAHPGAELGRLAAELLIRQAENPHFGHQRRKIRPRLLWTGGEGHSPFKR